MIDEAKSVNVRQFHLFERETLREAGKPSERAVPHVVTSAVFEDPFAG